MTILRWLLIGAIAGQTYGVTKPRPYLRAGEAIHNLAVSHDARYFAYSSRDMMGLRVIDVKTRRETQVTPHKVGTGYFWSPYGRGLVFKEVARSSEGRVISKVMSYEPQTQRKILVDERKAPIGILNFDPRDYHISYLTGKAIRFKVIEIPDVRKAKWQLAANPELGRWLVTHGDILWVTKNGLAMKPIQKGIPQKPVRFQISPKGDKITWESAGGQIFWSELGGPPKLVGPGHDPTWHPKSELIAYAASRLVGTKEISTDLKLTDLSGKEKFLTVSQVSSERSPRFSRDGKRLYYTLAGTTDIFMMKVP